MENTTLGIPAIHQTEALHGQLPLLTCFFCSPLLHHPHPDALSLFRARAGFIDMNGTIFPSPLAMGASFNVPLVKKVGERINYETVALGIAQ